MVVVSDAEVGEMSDISEKERTLVYNSIENKRRAARKIRARTYKKYMTTKLSMEEGRQLSIGLDIVYDPQLDSVTSASFLRYCGQSIFPGTHRHLSCHNQVGVDFRMECIAHSRAFNQRIQNDLQLREKRNARARTHYQKKKELGII